MVPWYQLPGGTRGLFLLPLPTRTRISATSYRPGCSESTTNFTMVAPCAAWYTPTAKEYGFLLTKHDRYPGAGARLSRSLLRQRLSASLPSPADQPTPRSPTLKVTTAPALRRCPLPYLVPCLLQTALRRRPICRRHWDLTGQPS